MPAKTDKYTFDQPIVPGADVIYRPAGEAGEYAPLATNPYRGCGHKCAYCLAPETIIQMADGSARQLRDVTIGDTLVGVSERDVPRRAWNYTFARSTVLNKISTRKPAVRITLESGHSAVCSGDHRWLTERGWKHADRLTLNNQIRIFAGPARETGPESDLYRRGYIAGVVQGDGTLKRYNYSGRFTRAGRSFPQRTDVQHHFRLAMTDSEALDRAASFLSSFGVVTHRVDFAAASGARAPMQAIRNHSAHAWERLREVMAPAEDDEWMRGWLAGIFDAEGGTTAGVIRIHNTDEGILSLTDRALASFGFRTVRDVANENGCSAVRVTGGFAEVVRFFNLTAPAIARKFPAVGASLRGSAKIATIEPLGESVEMMDITTSTENFIANGMVSHNCYVPLATKQDRREFDAGAVSRAGYPKRLLRDARRYQTFQVDAQVLLSFSTDPFHPGDNGLTAFTLETLAAHGMGFCTLTKGGERALPFMSLFRPDRDAFAATLTTLDDDFSRKWERGATLPAERIATLRAFHERGIFTWVSLEPTLDVEASLAIVRETHGFVDLYKIGRANYLKEITRTTDWRDYTLRMIDLCQRVGARHYIKRSLQEWLSAGYPNPLRVPQFHR